MSIYSEILHEKQAANDRCRSEADAAFANSASSVSAAVRQLERVQLVLARLLGRYGLNTVKVFGITNTDELLDAMLDPLGVMYDKVSLPNRDLFKSTESFLAFTDDGSPVELTRGIFGYTVRPLTGKKSRYNKHTRLQKTAYIIYRPFPGNTVTAKSFVSLILKLIAPTEILMLFAMALAISLLGLITPRANQYVLKTLLPLGGAAYGALVTTGVYLLITGIVQSLIQGIKSLAINRLSLRVSKSVEAAVMARFLLHHTVGDRTNSSEKKTLYLRYASSVTGHMLSIAFSSSLTSIFSVFYIGQMFQFSHALWTPSFIGLLLQAVFTAVLAFASMRNSRELLEATGESNSFMHSSMRGIRKVQSMGAQDRIYGKWAGQYLLKLERSTNPPKLVKYGSVVNSFIGSATSLLTYAVAFPSGVLREDFIAFHSSLSLATTAVNSLTNLIQSVVEMKPQLEKLKNLSIDTERSGLMLYRNSLKGSIVLENVTFSYGRDDFPCIDHLDLVINPGDKVAFVGESGCGKSTLMKLIVGIENPVSGMIRFDGFDTMQLNMRSVRKRIGSVFQFSRLIPGTVFDNIDFLTRSITVEEAWDAAEKAAIADDIRAMNLGMDTEVSMSQTGGLSGGQRQRLLLARVFAAKPDIMILDEATSSLDNDAQAHVLESVLSSPATALIVAHRLSTVKKCGRILFIENGNIAEEGTYDELMSLNGRFAKMARRQIA